CPCRKAHRCHAVAPYYRSKYRHGGLANDRSSLGKRWRDVPSVCSNAGETSRAGRKIGRTHFRRAFVSPTHGEYLLGMIASHGHDEIGASLVRSALSKGML